MLQVLILDLHTDGVDECAESLNNEKSSVSATENRVSDVSTKEQSIENQTPPVVVI